MNIRERTEHFEDITLIPEATHVKNSRGRERFEEQEDYRTAFMIDRDRIIHSKSFRRLKHKTQVYIRTSGDHYRTRLTHTLEVSQIARTIARGLQLNEDLTEAITLGHDIGHVAFAHNGEDALDKLLDGGFRHYEQSVRVLTKLENEGRGLNLTEEVLEGIMLHSGLGGKAKGSLEAQISKFSDKIAYVNHDIDDSIRAGILKLEDIPREYIEILGNTHSKRIDTLVRALVKSTKENLDNNNILVSLPELEGNALMALRSFMFKNVYLGEEQKVQRDKAIFIIDNLFAHYLKNPDEMPKLYKYIAAEEGEKRAVADYIAGMSDDFAIMVFEKVFIPKIII
ncbi:MAG: deoxyguanosinetriphosphate triphosphohydrolase [Clostridiaceae bacterium]